MPTNDAPAGGPTPIEPSVTVRQVAFNPLTRRWEVVYPESEIPAGVALVTEYWCRSGNCWVTIPE